jgi:tRNA-2-methylthio-N6-dimethylallyladenosine synthase
VTQIRQARAGIAITSDIIVGFPGETAADYQQTRELVKEVEFDNAFVFRYSPRRDTPAAEMPNQVEEHIKEERNQDLLTLVNESAWRSGERLVGQRAEILCEGRSKTNGRRLMGRTSSNKIVVFEGKENLAGNIFDVHITQANGFSLYGTPAL